MARHDRDAAPAPAAVNVTAAFAAIPDHSTMSITPHHAAHGTRVGAHGDPRPHGRLGGRDLRRPRASPSISIAASRILYFWTLPVTVIGNSSVTCT